MLKHWTSLCPEMLVLTWIRFLFSLYAYHFPEIVAVLQDISILQHYIMCQSVIDVH